MASDQFNATTSIDRIYAQALLELVEPSGQIDAVRDELVEISELMTCEPGLVKLLDSRILRSESLAASIKSIFEGKISDTVYRFIQIVNAKGRISELQGIIRAFVQLVEIKHGIVQVEAYVASPISDAQVASVAAGIGKALGKTVVLKQHLDPSLLGGMKLRVGDKLIDGSAVAQLKILRQRITEQGREKARSARESA